MKWFFSAALSIVALSALAFYFADGPATKRLPYSVADKITSDRRTEELKRIKTFGTDIASFARKGNYNTRYCFLVDMKRPSGSNRFFIYDMKKDSVLDEGLVAHGSGTTVDDPNTITFSNKPNSYCSSLGKYSIGKSYTGTFGLAYKLYGLEKTNDKAFDRFVVLHAHNCVPDEEIAPAEICRSWGCPTVSPAFLKKLSGYIDNSEKPVLLWVFN